MQHSHAARAYRAASAHRSPKQQEADVFRRATGALRAARDGTPMERTKALADNTQLWMTISGLMQDPENALPAPLRASIVSVEKALQREMRQAEPDFAFLIAVNEDITAGLCGVP